MKKQDNESLIQEIQKRLDWYTMEASDEEFDADEVQNLLKLLDGLTPEEEKDRLSSDEVVDNFWKYCAEREEEERILAEADETRKRKTVRCNGISRDTNRWPWRRWPWLLSCWEAPGRWR